MKVCKEEICGPRKAVELYVAHDHAADLRRWNGWTQTVLDAVHELSAGGAGGPGKFYRGRRLAAGGIAGNGACGSCWYQ